MTPKEQALALRMRGSSVREIERRLGIARSTLSYWFRGISMPRIHQRRLQKRWEHALVHARARASQWHRDQKKKRILNAHQAAQNVLSRIKIDNKDVIDLALSMLYLGEGFKTNGATGMGNSNPTILRFFLAALEKNYGLSRKNLKCELHLRADQDPSQLIHYWSRQLKIPKKNFRKPIVDQRTAGRPTYPNYKGVCAIQCGNVAIQRKLMYISNLFCDRIAEGA